ncbi:hypothetical protein [Helicobacter labacensis]|uniref:hypothetical protein n=1 Tax=Helicobacter labacensis TaxID=2316079 RepID=UPI001F204A39|nr:hypothetical protein [Helicobacter labacensis]
MTQSTQEKLFSIPRLRGYTSLAEHEANFALIGLISHKIGILAVVIRNQIDSVLLEQVGDWWQDLPPSIKISGERTSFIQSEIYPGIEITLKTTGDISHVTPTTLTSKQSMGFWLKVVEYFKIYDKIFNPSFLNALDFKRYYHANKNRFNDTKDLRHHQKAKILLQLLRNLRNRAFHFENLYKYTPKGDPRLSTKITNYKGDQELYVALHPDKIPIFLDDLLRSFAPELVGYASGGKGST